LKSAHRSGAFLPPASTPMDPHMCLLRGSAAARARCHRLAPASSPRPPPPHCESELSPSFFFFLLMDALRGQSSSMAMAIKASNRTVFRAQKRGATSEMEPVSSSPAPMGSNKPDLWSTASNQRDLVLHGQVSPSFYSMLYVLVNFVTNA
jgi:hypothetical protein